MRAPKPTTHDVLKVTIEKRAGECTLQALMRDGRWPALYCMHAVEEAVIEGLLVWDANNHFLAITPKGRDLLSQAETPTR